MRLNGEVNLLNKSVSTAATIVILLKLDILEFAKRLKDGLQVLFRDVEVDITNIEAVERNGIRVCTRRLGIASLSILLSFSELDDNRNTCQWLSGELKCLLNRFFVFKFNITNSGNHC